MEKAGKILMIASAWVLCACVTDYESVAPSTMVNITVVDQNGAPVSGVDVYRAPSRQVFNEVVASPGLSEMAPEVTGADGKVSLVVGTDSIYIYAYHKNTAIVPGAYITEDNSEGEYRLKNLLTRGSVSELTITIKPSDGFITFWTALSNTMVLPVEILYGTTSMGVVSQGLTATPSLFGPGALTLRTKRGSATFEGKSSAGCLWNNTLSLAGAQSIFYQLSDCTVGTIAFFADNTNSTRLPMTLTLNANDDLTNLTSVVSSIPTDCSAGNMVKVFRVPGNYTYEAISMSSICLWTGSFSLAANQCKLIQLVTCP